MPENNEEGQAENQENLEIHLGSGDSEPPTDPKAQRLKSWANIIATTAALLTAVAAVFKPQDQTVNRNTYEQLKASIESTNEDVKRNHDDMVVLHSYLQGYFAGSAMFVAPPVNSALPILSTTTSTSTSSKPPTIQSAPIISFSAPSATTSYRLVPFPFPTVTPRASAQPIPTFESVAGKK